MAGKLSTHALDTLQGIPAAGMNVHLERLTPEPAYLCTTQLNADGRAILIEGAPPPGVYQLTFHVGEYYRTTTAAPALELIASPAFLDEVVVRFGISAASSSYHVPLVFSPHAYSTYRGS
ncbi:MAG: hydroxyisourate hydrolase [Steroidobacteraceae bacterium]